MQTFPLYFLLMVLSLPIVVAMPDPLSFDRWEHPTDPPPTLPHPPMDGPGRSFHPDGFNMTELPVGALETYCQMLLQGLVSMPTDQIPWFCLSIQYQSTQGPKGDRGDRGLPGSPGSPGRRGLSGFRGPPGPQGRPGIKGQKGDDGEKGQRGPPGLVGPKGERGFKGDKGDQGLEGHPGAQGPKGDDGVCPDRCEHSHRFPGTPGLPGPVGPRGLPGAKGMPGPRGLKGDMGDLGHPGGPGLVGEKGEPGPKGECHCTDGLDGDPGQKGDKGDMGHQGDTGPAGQRGPQGDKGNLGPVGLMGPPGPCMPTIQSAFAAGLMSSYPPPNSPVVFPYVHYNIQGSYDPSNGLYTAPINGTYVFSYHLTVHERVLKVGLFHNFLPVVKTTDPKVLGTTSHSIILHLVRGDRVWIQVKDSVTNGMYAGIEASSTFSGFLLHPDTCDVALLRAPMPPLMVPEGGYSWGKIPEPTTAPAVVGS